MHKLRIIGLNTVHGFASPLFNFLIVLFGVKIYGKENWASLINVTIWIYFVAFVLGWGNRDYLLRRYSKNPGKMYHAFFSNFFTRSLLLSLSVIFLFFFETQVAFWAIILVVLNFCYSSLNTLVVYHHKFGKQLIAEIIGFSCLFSCLFYFSEFSLILFLKVYAISLLLKLVFLITQLNFWKEPVLVKVSLKELKEGLPFFVLGLSGWLVSKVDIYAVDYFLAPAQLAEYQLFITSFLMLQALAAYITIPFTKHIHRLSEKVIQKMKLKLYTVSIPFVIAGALLIWIVMELFIQLGFDFTFYLLGALMALPSYYYTITIMELIKNNNERIIIYISFIGFAVSLVLISILIKPYEVLGVLLSVCLSQWLVLVLFKLNSKLKITN